MTLEASSGDIANIFDLAPISLWLEDYSDLRQLFEEWRREGISDLRAFLWEDPERLWLCTSKIRILQVNQKTLSLFEANDVDHLRTSIRNVFRKDMLEPHIDEMVQLWNRQNTFYSNSVNYSLNGRRIDIQLKGRILPGHEESWDRVLLTLEDVTEREDALREQRRLKQYAEALFEHSPVSLWVEDFSTIKKLLEEVRERGIVDFRVFTDVHPEFVRQCMSEIRVLDVNNETLSLFLAADKEELLQNLPRILRDEMEISFREQLIDLWNGTYFQRREVINYALDGSMRYILMQFSILPGYEADWSRVQVALTDITARKKAEAYLEYLGKHDVLTKLHNRAFYVDELNRLERKGQRPVSVIIIDLDDLKNANDQWGHAAGDGLLRRIGEVLNEAISEPNTASRIGGDEFAIIMPFVDERACEATVERIKQLVDINNQYYSQLKLSLSIGWATSRDHESLESVVKRADMAMYENKHARMRRNVLEI